MRIPGITRIPYFAGNMSGKQEFLIQTASIRRGHPLPKNDLLGSVPNPNYFYAMASQECVPNEVEN